MTDALVSILIPCFNAEQFIAATIESALAQKWRQKEIIVVDDGSTDRSLELAEGFRGNGVRLIAQEHSGASAARNRGLAEAKGAFIQFLDADDLLSPNKIAVQMQHLATKRRGSIGSCVWARFRGDPSECVTRADLLREYLLPVDWLTLSWSRGAMMPCNAWLTPRQVLEKAGEWNETLSGNDDGEFFTRIILNSAGVAFCKEAQAYYRSASDSLSQSKTFEVLSSVYRSIELSMKHLLAVENNERTRLACAALFQNFAHSTYPRAPELVRRAEAMVALLGGSHVAPDLGGVGPRLLTRIFGWKVAARVKHLYSRVTL